MVGRGRMVERDLMFVGEMGDDLWGGGGVCGSMRLRCSFVLGIPRRKTGDSPAADVLSI